MRFIKVDGAWRRAELLVDVLREDVEVMVEEAEHADYGWEWRAYGRRGFALTQDAAMEAADRAAAIRGLR